MWRTFQTPLACASMQFCSPNLPCKTPTLSWIFGGWRNWNLKRRRILTINLDGLTPLKSCISSLLAFCIISEICQTMLSPSSSLLSCNLCGALDKWWVSVNFLCLSFWITLGHTNTSETFQSFHPLPFSRANSVCMFIAASCCLLFPPRLCAVDQA